MTKSQDHIARVDVDGEDIHWDLTDRTSYGGYLCLDALLSAQRPRTAEHDELMFIGVHQVSELWLKMLLHEISGVLECVRTGALDPAFKMLSRTSRIQEQLIQVWGVLSTLTPMDYAAFRDELGEASGFQSHQYRIVEYTLGNKNAALAKVHKHNPTVHAAVEGALNAPSLYDEALRLLARRGIEVPQDKIERDWSKPYEPDEAVELAWLQVYRDTEKYWDLYELAEKLVDVEDNFQRWRFRHMKTVSRIIGMKSGTGGSSGVPYLQKALGLRFFPELWDVRTRI